MQNITSIAVITDIQDYTATTSNDNSASKRLKNLLGRTLDHKTKAALLAGGAILATSAVTFAFFNGLRDEIPNSLENHSDSTFNLTNKTITNETSLFEKIVFSFTNLSVPAQTLTVIYGLFYIIVGKALLTGSITPSLDDFKKCISL